jgi:hypothetical protein
MMERQGINPPRVPLLIDDADRQWRERVLACEASVESHFGCPMSAKGQSGMCWIENAFGVRHDEPCIKVDGGW